MSKRIFLFLLLSNNIITHALIKTQNLSLKTTFHMPERNTFSNIYINFFFNFQRFRTPSLNDLIFETTWKINSCRKLSLVRNFCPGIKVDFHEANLFLAFWLVRKIDFAAKYFASQEIGNDFYFFAAKYFSSANYSPRGQTKIFYIFQRHCLWHYLIVLNFCDFAQIRENKFR